LIICIGFALGILLWPSLVKVLEVLIHPPLLGVTRFLHTRNDVTLGSSLGCLNYKAVFN
jgi:hypothetical protein